MIYINFQKEIKQGKHLYPNLSDIELVKMISTKIKKEHFLNTEETEQIKHELEDRLNLSNY